MNIGIDIKALKNGSTGISRYIRSILDELQRIDPKNRYYLFECKKSNYALSNPNWHKITQNSKLPGTVWQQMLLPKLIRKYKIDIFWAPEQISPVIGIPSKTKIVATIHDFTALRYPQTCQTSNLMIYRMLFPSTIRISSALIPVSDYIKKELNEFYPYAQSPPRIIRTVSNGAKDWEYEVRSVERKNFFFFPGNSEPRKNLPRLIKALEIVNASGIELDLHICGPYGWKNANLHKLIELSPIRNRIKHLGYLSETDLLNQYLTCKAVIFPSIYEGFGLPVLEALRLNTPVLTSKGTVMEEIAGQNAIYFDPYDVKSIADAITQLLKSGAKPIDQESLSRYSWKRSAEDLLEIFTDMGKHNI